MGWGGGGYRPTKGELVSRAMARWSKLEDVKRIGSTGLSFSGTHDATRMRAHVTLYHHTDIIVRWADGRVTYNTGGWDTMSTRFRMGIHSQLGVVWKGGVPFRERLTVHPGYDAVYESDIPADEVARLQRERQVVSTHWSHLDAATRHDVVLWAVGQYARLRGARRRAALAKLDLALHHGKCLTRLARQWVRATG